MLRLSGCQVRRRHASSGLLDIDSRLAQGPVDAVGELTRLLFAGEKTPAFEAFIAPGPNIGRPMCRPWGDWKGFAPDGTLRRRPGVLVPAEYMLSACELEWDRVGDVIPEAHRGLVCPVEKVAEVGVLKSLGEGGRYGE